MGRKSRAGLRAAILVAVSLLALAAAIPAHGLDTRDPDLFGAGEGWPAPQLGPGTRGVWVTELQQALGVVGFRTGVDDGRYGAATAVAVQTFQKLHELPIDSVFKPEYWSILEAGVIPGPNGEADRIEIDLARQVLILILDDEVSSVLPVSTASGGRYVNFSGRVVTSRTPEGRFEVYNRRFGWHESYLGWMYNPFYFTGGYAIHGSPEVPNHPASHGCVRVRIHDMNYLETELSMGMPVYVYGKRTARHEVILPDPVIPDLVASAVRASA